MFREIEKNIETQTKSEQSTWTKTLKYKHWNFRGTQNRARWVYGGRERKRGHLGRGRSWWTDWCWRRWELRVSMVLGLCLDGFFSQPCPTREIMRWTTPLEFGIKAGSQKRSRKWFLCWFREVSEIREWGGWVISNVIRRKGAKNEWKGSVELLLKKPKKERVPTV